MKAPSKKIIRDQSAGQIAEIFAVHESTVRGWAGDGCPNQRHKPNGKLFFNEGEVHLWLESERRTGKPGRPASAVSQEILAVQCRKETAMAVNWEHRNKELEKQLVNKAEYRGLWQKELRMMKNKFSDFASSIAPKCVGIDAGEVQGIIDTRIKQIFRELSEQ